jgi:hypothetical protein
MDYMLQILVVDIRKILWAESVYIVELKLFCNDSVILFPGVQW